MPVTPRANRKTSNSRRNETKSKETSPKPRPQSVYEPTSVQDRIRQWQAQGAADAASPDALSVRSLPLSDHAIETPRAQTPERKPPNTTPSWRQRFLEKERELRAEEKAARDPVAPKKRVISDDHWKAKREDRNRTSPKTGSRNNVQTPHYDLSYTSTQPQTEREARRAERRRARQSKENGDTEQRDHGSIAVQDLNSYIDQELARHLDSPVYHDNHSDKASARSPLLADDHDAPISSGKYAESLGRPDRSHAVADPLSTRPKGARIFSKTKEIFNKAEEPPLPENRVPSIEAWLDEQPDPFVEVDNKIMPAVEVPEPLRKRSRRTKRKSRTRQTADPNQIWDAVTVHEDNPSGDPRSSHPASLAREAESEVMEKRRSVREQMAPEASPTGLKRTGARTQRKPQPPEHRTSSSQSRQGTDSPLRPVAQNEDRPQRGGPPTRGRHLETIASVETFKENEEPPPYDDQLAAEPCGLKRKLTTHEDLMSVLSLPLHRKSTRSRRKPQTLSSQSAAEVLQALVVEEEKYARELKTLVDGVIPVLLQCVLSKSDSVAAAGLFTSAVTGNDELAFTKPIVDMGIALERLKSLHARIPLHNVDSLLIWGQNVQRGYNDYLQAWRLGFHDVVVNLAPLKEGDGNADTGMSRDAEGDVVNAEGNKVDVAYLLKRPLVRVKNLSRTFSCVQEQTGIDLAAEVASIFADLTATARRRHQEEQARLEDEAAAGIDATRTRNIRTLGSNANVAVVRTRKVRARDCFNLTMYHSTGQRLDCRVEMIFRDNPADQASGGDVLICEIDESGKWLLFAPVTLSTISARRGEEGFDLVIMIRGPSGIGQEWQELLALKSDDPEATTEWLSMLGSHPLPPKLNRKNSFKEAEQPLSSASDRHQPPVPDTISEVDILPIGEPSVLGRSERSSPTSKAQKPLLEKLMPRLNLGGGLQSKQASSRPKADRPSPKPFTPSVISSDRSTISDLSLKDLPKSPKASSAPTTPSHNSIQTHSQKINRPLKHEAQFMMSGGLPALDIVPTANTSSVRTEDQEQAVQKSPSTTTPRPSVDISKVSASYESSPNSARPAGRPTYNRALSSTPSQDLPTINKLRGSSAKEQAPTSTPLNESIRDQWNALSGSGNSGDRRRHRSRKAKSEIFTEDIPSPPTHTPNRGPPPMSAMVRPGQSRPVSQPPPPPPHGDLSGSMRKPEDTATAEPQLKSTPRPDRAKKRRSSSPLKREYAPSTASESSAETDSDDMSDSSSDTSQDFMSEVKDMHTPLVAVTAGKRRSLQMAPQHTPTVPTAGTRTLAPSDSASQGPYRRVPSSSNVPDNKKNKTIALVCAWSDKGSWEQIYPDECSIVISPGLIEAFEMSAAHSGANELARSQYSDESDSRTSSLTAQPLVAFELTPIVPLRRGTALDINIRSPPTANSKLKTTSNIMFRSRNADECDSLYGMINWARCNNPTYIQLQNARPKQPAVTFNLAQPESSRPRSGSWFGFGGSEKKSSYRASSAPGGTSVGGDSEASIGTMSTAISALKRFGVSSAFNLNSSSVTRKSGLSRASGSLYSSSTGTRTGSGSGSSTPIASQLGFVPGKDGPNVPSTSAEAAAGAGMVNNMKIRLYLRKDQSWENLGAGRLSVLPAPEMAPKPGEVHSAGGSGQSTPTRQPSTGIPGQPGFKGPRLSSSNHTPHRIHGNGREKRIVIRKNKAANVVLLDVVLGESCFERVMQTGIAVKVWEEDEQIGDRGGVVMGRERIYMMQFPGTREAGWVFGLCGTYRYGID